MNYLSLIPAKVWFGLLGAALLVGACFWGYHAIHEDGIQIGANQVQVQWDAEKLAIAQQTMAIKAEAQAKTDKLTADSVQLRKDKNAQISRLNISLADALDRLRNRPERPSENDLSSHAGTGATIGATGAQLYREDGQFLAGESARAEGIRFNLIECQSLYAKARAAVQ